MLKHALFITILLLSAPALAQDTRYEARLELADQMLQINPPRDQVRVAINTYIEQLMAGRSKLEQDQFRIAMMTIVNHRALEQLSREAYVELFTEAELRAMVEYYSKPEAISAREKLPEFQQRLTPEIIRMIDQALMRARTSAQ
jgi:secreted Zn-dependent insulinase-like peptidase